MENNENLDAYFMSDAQLLKLLSNLSEDTCMIEFIGHMSLDEHGESVVKSDELPWVIFGKHNIDEEIFSSIVNETEWTKWLTKEFQGEGTYSFRAIVKLSMSDVLEGYVSHGEVELIITDEDEAKQTDRVSNLLRSLAKVFEIIEKMKK
jgi:hypothetical protein